MDYRDALSKIGDGSSGGDKAYDELVEKNNVKDQSVLGAMLGGTAGECPRRRDAWYSTSRCCPRTVA